MALFAALPFGSGLFSRDAAFLVAHLKQPNFTPRAIPMDGVNAESPPGAGCLAQKQASARPRTIRQQTLAQVLVVMKETSKNWAYVWVKHYQNPRCPAEPSVDRPRNY